MYIVYQTFVTLDRLTKNKKPYKESYKPITQGQKK